MPLLVILPHTTKKCFSSLQFLSRNGPPRLQRYRLRSRKGLPSICTLNTDFLQLRKDVAAKKWPLVVKPHQVWTFCTTANTNHVHQQRTCSTLVRHQLTGLYILFAHIDKGKKLDFCFLCPLNFKRHNQSVGI